MRNNNIIFTTTDYSFSYYTVIKFINDSTGFIACKDSLNKTVILKTNDSGISWSEKKVISDTIFKDIHFISDSIGFAIGNKGCLLKTIDCGENWQNINTNTNNNLNYIDSSNDSIIYIVGGNGLILKSTDYGQNWNQISFVNSNSLKKIKLFNNGSAYILDINGDLYGNDLVSINKQNTANDIKVYPNPVSDILNISTPKPSNSYKYYLFSLQSKLLISTNKDKIDISSFKSGIYILIIESKDDVSFRKIIKE